MMEKTGKSSEFSAAYKLKSGSSLKKKDARLHRRSIEWKSLRGEEVDKRRNLKNLSPLQEIKENQHLCSMYKDKTPTKPNKGETDSSTSSTTRIIFFHFSNAKRIVMKFTYRVLWHHIYVDTTCYKCSVYDEWKVS